MDTGHGESLQDVFRFAVHLVEGSVLGSESELLVNERVLTELNSRYINVMRGQSCCFEIIYYKPLS